MGNESLLQKCPACDILLQQKTPPRLGCCLPLNHKTMAVRDYSSFQASAPAVAIPAHPSLLSHQCLLRDRLNSMSPPGCLPGPLLQHFMEHHVTSRSPSLSQGKKKKISPRAVLGFRLPPRFDHSGQHLIGIWPGLGSSILAFCCVTCNSFLSLSEPCFLSFTAYFTPVADLVSSLILRTDTRTGAKLSYCVQTALLSNPNGRVSHSQTQA